MEKLHHVSLSDGDVLTIQLEGGGAAMQFEPNMRAGDIAHDLEILAFRLREGARNRAKEREEREGEVKALLVGGPKHGTVLYVKGRHDVVMEHDDKRYEYRFTQFTCKSKATGTVTRVFLHGLDFDARTIAAYLESDEVRAKLTASEPPH